jgi:outer membrane protein assembly factor BamB
LTLNPLGCYAWGRRIASLVATLNPEHPVIAHPLNRPRFVTAVNLFFPVVGLIFLLISGCGPHNQKPDYNPPQALNVNTFTREWSSSLGNKNGQITRVFARENFVFAYTDSGRVYVLARNDGHVIAINDISAAARAGGRLHAPVVLKDAIVYPTSTSLEIYNLDGTFNHSKNLHHSVRSEVVGSGHYLFYGADYTNGGRLVEGDIDSRLDHRQELMFPHASVSSRPVVIGDIVYCAAENGDVVAVSTDTFHAMWSLPNGVFHTYGSIEANLVADDANIYIASTDNKLVCIARSNARVKWQYTASSSLRDTPAVTKDMIFQHVPDVGLVAISKDAGDFNRHPKWVAPDVTQFLGADDQHIYGRRKDNAIVAMDKNSGQVLFTSARPDFTAFAPNQAGNIIYAATKTGRVMAVKPVLTPGGMGEVVMAPARPQEMVSAN